MRLSPRLRLTLGAAFGRAQPLPIRAESPKTGLFGNELLNHPANFALLNAQTRQRAEELLEEAVPSGAKRERKVVAVMDDLSNVICCSADLTECVRLLHPDPQWKSAADASMADFTELVETLNTSTGLYRAVEAAKDEPPADPIDSHISRLFLQDFQASGVHLPAEERSKFVELSGDVFQFGADFTRNAGRPVEVDLSSDVPEGALPRLVQAKQGMLSRTRSYLTHPLSDDPDPSVRSWGYATYFQPLKAQEDFLKALLVARGRLAKLTGFPSYAHRAQSHALLETPEEIDVFLKGLVSALSPRMTAELSAIGGSAEAPLSAAHYPLLAGTHRAKLAGLQRGTLKPYFGLAQLMESLQRLCSSLYGVSLVAVEAASGELWHPAVRKLEVRSKEGDLLGHVFCDFHQRPEKLGGDCHFTVRCSKELPCGRKQRPVVVLSLSLSEGRELSLGEAENLYHEMGHALHSMLAQTRYQHVSGTRCSTDLAEVPSNLMERLFYDARVLGRLEAAHGQRMPEELAQRLCASAQAFAATDVVQQASYALLDQSLHGMDEAELRGLDTVAHFGELQRRYVPGLTQPQDPAWHHRFCHLVSYGGRYHAYLVAKSLSFLIYNKLGFKEDPLSARSGKAWAAAQALGGEKPTKVLLKDVLGFQPEPLHLVEAIAEAMK